jgi:hypothetical protein
MFPRLSARQWLLVGCLFAAGCTLGVARYGTAPSRARVTSPRPAVLPTRAKARVHVAYDEPIASASGDEEDDAPPAQFPTVPISSNSTVRSLPSTTGAVGAPGSTFSLTTRPNADNPGLLDSAGQVGAAGSTFSLGTTYGEPVASSSTYSNSMRRAALPMLSSALSGVAEAGPGGYASYPLAVPAPYMRSAPSMPVASVPAAWMSPPTPPRQASPDWFGAPYSGGAGYGYPYGYPYGNAAYGPPLPFFINVPNRGAAAEAGPYVGPTGINGPASYIEPILRPLPGAKSRGVAFSEWESYRTDVAGRNIVATTDDSNLWLDRNGKLNGNTGDTDASGLNVTDANDSVIRGTESADEAPYQTIAAAIVDLASEGPSVVNRPPPVSASPLGPTVPVARQPRELGDPVLTSDGPLTSVTNPTGSTTARAFPTTPPVTGYRANAVPGAAAAFHAFGGDDGDGIAGFDFPYTAWTSQINGGSASAVHTDDGTTLASGADAVVVGGDGYDDDDNRAVGENILLTRDDGNIAIGGWGDVNSQIGDSEQGAVIMNVNRVFIQGGGAY